MIRASLGLLCFAFLCQCRTTHSIDRRDVRSWNETGVWVPMHGSHVDYLPSDFKQRPSPKPADGQWVTDPQDGLRFYIPTRGTRRYPAGVLRGEAFKATNRYPLAQQKNRNLGAALLVPVHVATLGVALWDWDNSSGGSPGSGGSSSSTDSGNSTSNCKDHGNSNMSCRGGEGRSGR